MRGTTILAVVFILWGATALQPYVSAQTSDRRCNNRLILGTYGFSIEGQKLAGPGPVGPQVGVAITTFDGAGNLSQIDSIVIGFPKTGDPLR